MSLFTTSTRMEDAAADGRGEEAEEGRRIGHDEAGQAKSHILSRPLEDNAPSSSPGPNTSTCGRFGGLRRRVVSSKKFAISGNDDDDDDGATQKTSGYMSTSASEVSEFFGSLFDPSHRGGGSDNAGHRPSSRPAAQRKQHNSLEKLGRSDCSDMLLVVDEEDIDFVVSLKLLLAEAKSDADAASVENASLVKETVRLEHCLEATTSRIDELETELQYQRNLAATTTKIASRLEASNLLLKRQLTAARKEINTRRAATTADKAKSTSDVGTDLELSVMRRRVEDLEKQNRMLRSELVGAGHELDEHRHQHQQSLTTLDAAAADIGCPDEVSSMHSDEEQRELNFPPDSTQHIEGGGNSSGRLFVVDGDICGTIDCL